MKTLSFVRRKFNALLGVATVSMAINFIVMLASSLIAGNFLGATGLAGINVCTPVFSAVSFAGLLLSVGSGLVFSRALGEFDEHRAAGIWSQSALLAVGLGLAIMLAMLGGGEAYLDFNGVTGEIRSAAASYWRWQSVSMGLTPPVLLVMAMVYADGDGTVALMAGASYVLGTLGFASLFTALGGHAGGISAGTSLAQVLVLAVGALHFLRPANHLKFIRYFKVRDLLRTLAGSAPDATIYLCWGVMALVINRLTVVCFGEEMLAVVALGVSVVQFSIVFDGVGEALIPLGGMYAGERNWPALRELARHSAVVAIAEGVLVGAVMLAFAEPIAAWYGFRGEAAALHPQAVLTLRWMALAMPLMGLLMMLNTHYLIVGHLGLAVSVTVLKDFLLPCFSVMAASAFFGFEGIWMGLVIGYLLAVVYPFAFVAWRYGRAKFPWLVVRDCQSLDFAVRLGGESLAAAGERIGSFLTEAGVAESLVRQVKLTIAENGHVIIAQNRARPPMMEFFVSLEQSGRVRMILRDDGVVLVTPFSRFSESRYLNTLNCNRTEHWFGRGEFGCHFN